MPDWVVGVCVEPERSQLAWAMAVTNAAPTRRPTFMTGELCRIASPSDQSGPRLSAGGDSSGAESAELEGPKAIVAGWYFTHCSKEGIVWPYVTCGDDRRLWSAFDDGRYADLR